MHSKVQFSMKISIITVSFNAAKTIAATIDSVVAQTYTNIEHIVIDGASTDGTLAVIDRYRSKLAKVISETDHGIYDAMNKGLSLATGDIIGFLNADDIYTQNDILETVAKLMAQDNLDAIMGDAEFVHPQNPTRPVRRFRSNRFNPSRIAWGWMPAHPALFLHRNVFERFGIFKTSYRIAGDFELVARIFHQGTLKYQHVPNVWVRMLTGGVSTGGWRNTILLNQEVLRACRENGIQTNFLKILSKYLVKPLEFLNK